MTYYCCGGNCCKAGHVCCEGICCPAGYGCVEGVCKIVSSTDTPGTDDTPVTTDAATTGAVQNFENQKTEFSNQYCYNNSHCQIYYINYTDGCHNKIYEDGPYTDEEEAQFNINQNVPYSKDNDCYHQYTIKVIKRPGYCCNNTCSIEPCLQEKSIYNENKWCLYDKYCYINISSPKYILETPTDEECSPHPFGLTIEIADTEYEALEWLQTENECE
jgi:hypothetical protein